MSIALPEYMQPWLEELMARHDAGPITAEDKYFEQAIKRIHGGPPPKGYPKPKPEKPPVSGEAAEAIHRAMVNSAAGRR